MLREEDPFGKALTALTETCTLSSRTVIKALFRSTAVVIKLWLSCTPPNTDFHEQLEIALQHNIIVHFKLQSRRTTKDGNGSGKYHEMKKFTFLEFHWFSLTISWLYVFLQMRFCCEYFRHKIPFGLSLFQSPLYFRRRIVDDVSGRHALSSNKWPSTNHPLQAFLIVSRTV